MISSNIGTQSAPLRLVVRCDNLSFKIPVRDPKSIQDDAPEKLALDSFTGTFVPGELVAILGPSGSGKTTLLSILANRLQHSSGDVFFNDTPPTNQSKRLVSFVTQDDLMHGCLSVRETLEFTGRLRLPASWTDEKKIARVQELISRLRLDKCAETRIGGRFERGISGGERKRVAVGSELLSNPSLLLADEPTSGLDSASAVLLLEILREYAQTRAVVLSIHQPSSALFHMFDRCIFLSEGRIVYTGTPANLGNFLAELNEPCPVNFNSADHIMDLVSGEGASGMREKLVAAAATASIGIQEKRDVPDVDESDNDSSEKFPIGFWPQFRLLVWRSRRLRQDGSFSLLTLIEMLGFAFILSFLWWRTDRNESLIQERMGLLFMIVAFWSFHPLFQALTAFISERAILEKERMSGLYRLSAYFIAKTVVEFAFAGGYPILFFTILFFPTNLNPNAGAFFSMLGYLVLGVIVSESVGLLISSAVLDMKKAMVTSTMFTLGTLMLGGFFVKQLPDWIAWMRYTSFVNYMFAGMARSEFADNNRYECAANTLQPVCPIPADTIRVEYAIDFIPDWSLIAVPILFAVACRCASYLYLRKNTKGK